VPSLIIEDPSILSATASRDDLNGKKRLKISFDYHCTSCGDGVKIGIEFVSFPLGNFCGPSNHTIEADLIVPGQPTVHDDFDFIIKKRAASISVWLHAFPDYNCEDPFFNEFTLLRQNTLAPIYLKYSYNKDLFDVVGVFFASGIDLTPVNYTIDSQLGIVEFTNNHTTFYGEEYKIYFRPKNCHPTANNNQSFQVTATCNENPSDESCKLTSSETRIPVAYISSKAAKYRKVRSFLFNSSFRVGDFPNKLVLPVVSICCT
jgi:hypothetical protein